jgi:hypothetical protein
VKAPTIEGYAGKVLACTRDRRTFAALSNDGIQLWETTTRRPRGELRPSGREVRSVCFADNGRRLATVDQHGVVLVWDLPTLFGDPAIAPPTPADLSSLWLDLGESSGPRAFRAVLRLASAPRQTVPWMRERLLRKVPDAADVERLIGDLDDDAFPVRQRASQDLLYAGSQVESALRQAEQWTESSEVRRRIERLREALERKAAETWRVRAVEVLEYAATEEARTLLRDLARGHPQDTLTQQAAAALTRLASR